MGRPDQYVRAAVAGTVAAGVAGFLLGALISGVGFLTWIASGVAGYGVGEAVRRGGGGNRADPFKWLAVGLTVAAVLVAWMVAFGAGPTVVVAEVVRRPLRLVTFAAAIYGVFRSIG
jgi:hypothetical protein